MKAAEVGYFRSFLLNQKSTILNKASELKNSELFISDGVTDDAELASRDLSTSLSLRLHERDRSCLYQIEKALGKIEYGTFGQCESCGETIEIKRLKARPFAHFCIDCMEETESSNQILN